ncbi:uncharacterized protein HMPREF1541_04653 [Cyphellophora europaea CBS 101466]|uniref:polynucleotide adenylyltransferase n=1 Tax=Cyphellophora europaea (strain CBS 101466) TaxID=1220924 RepID=W2RV61_CYPE1|nr:uncharacterized protein HMPREF1541_04653 [Cyphellophora europaea CBS 101466]ETN40376.1 hypothetical protein HMPREF1541_04653 [Cyphellophora europaea CBS 101466]
MSEVNSKLGSAEQVPATSRPFTKPLTASPPTRQHSKSMPSTPSQRPHPDNASDRSPSLHRNLNNISPRSLQSDPSHSNLIRRPPPGGCKYETGMARARRRVPYSLGPDKLPPDSTNAAKQLSHDREQCLTRDMRELYGHLVPTLESEDRRKRFIAKLERILCEKWPSTSIKVNVFGSTGNNLGTSDSDVDICITTDNKELLRVCSIAELLASKGMERVVCVSSAKVPIVKLWDPELQVASDLNVNNPIALENTALIKSYVDIDERVRPLAMFIKHWAKRRILNDAALGGTLSSYTWICLTLNFLQTRQPPLLPSLQRQHGLEPRLLDGVNVTFDENVSKYSAFGSENHSSLGELLYQFFRYYAYEFDFDENVVSVRQGGLISKSSKGWHMLQDNRLCVEEPFNTSRNLANTADDTSMRGIHLELRRAFDLIVDGKVEECCAQYEYPPDEIKPSEHLVLPQSRPVNLQAPQPQSIRPGKGNRQGRNAAHLKGSVAARRSSNPINRQPIYLRNLPFQMTTQELQSQALHQQHLLHDQLFQQYQYLQLQEQELRARLNQQNLRQQHLLAQQRGNYSGSGTLYGNQEDNLDSITAAAFNAQHRGPLSAPLYQARFGAPSPFLPPSFPGNGVTTNPSSPHLSPATPDSRRYSRRTSVGPSVTGGSLRAQSQPARGLVSSMSMTHLQAAPEIPDYSSSRRSSASATTHESGPTLSSQRSHGGSYHDANRKPAEYVGYYVAHSPSLLGYPPSNTISPLPSHAGLAIQNGGLSPRTMSRSPQASTATTGTTSPVKDLDARTPSRESGATVTRTVEASREKTSSPARSHAPLIVDGSVHSPRRRRANGGSREESEEQMTFSGSTSEDFAFDTPSSSDDADETATSHLTQGGLRPTEVPSYPAPLTNGHAVKYPQVVSDMGTCEEATAVTEQPHYAGHKPSHTAWSLPRQLSAVQEVRTPSPGFELSPPSMGSPFVGGSQREGKQSPLVPRETNNTGLATRTNGVTAVSNNASSWQTSSNRKKHRKKKATKSENDASTTNASGGDFLPVDEAQRKGG